MQEVKEHKQNKLKEKLDHKKLVVSDLHKSFMQRLQIIEQKREEKESVHRNIHSAFSKFNS